MNTLTRPPAIGTRRVAVRAARAVAALERGRRRVGAPDVGRRVAAGLGQVAQIGAVLGRDFAYPVLRDIADLDEPTLQAWLDRLAGVDLLFVEGAPPQVTGAYVEIGPASTPVRWISVAAASSSRLSSSTTTP